MTSNAVGFAAIERARAKLKAVGALPAIAAPLVAEKLRDICADNIAAARGPDGIPWQPTKSGTPPLRNAAKALTASAVGSVAILRLTGPEAKHHLGTARGHVKRQILPSQRMPAPVVDAIDAVISEQFRTAMK